MKVLATLGKVIASLVIVGILAVLAIFFFFVYMFKDYKERGSGIQSHPIFQDKTFEKYQIPLKEANKQYFQSNDIYYYFAKEVKEHIAGKCVERYIKEHNITDADGWRFPYNVNTNYIYENNITHDTVNKKFVNSIRKSKRLGYKDPQWIHDYKYDERIDCNLSLDENFESYVKGYRAFSSSEYREYNNGWVDYLFFNYK